MIPPHRQVGAVFLLLTVENHLSPPWTGYPLLILFADVCAMIGICGRVRPKNTTVNEPLKCFLFSFNWYIIKRLAGQIVNNLFDTPITELVVFRLGVHSEA